MPVQAVVGVVTNNKRAGLTRGISTRIVVVDNTNNGEGIIALFNHR